MCWLVPTIALPVVVVDVGVVAMGVDRGRRGVGALWVQAIVLGLFLEVWWLSVTWHG